MANPKFKKKKSPFRRFIFIMGGLLTFLLLLNLLGVFGKEEVTKVSLEKVKKTDIIEKVTASGKIQPEVEVKISSEISGEIISLLVEEGDSVVKGQLLARIRPDNIQAVVENAQANVNTQKANLAQSQSSVAQRKSELLQAKQEFDRNQQLYKDKVISQADFQTAQTNYEVAKQRVEAAQQSVSASRYNIQSAQANLKQSLDNLSRTEIYAPMSGTISKLSVEQGEKVVGTATMAGTEMMIIANLNNMEVQVDVNENDIVKINLGDTTEVDVDSYSSTGRKFEGVVTEIANTANATVTADAVTEFKVKIRILQSSYQDLIKRKEGKFFSPFRPGMTASVGIITETKNNVLTVPISAVTTRDDKDKKEEKDKNGKKEDNDSKKEEVQEVVFVYNEKTKKVNLKEVETGISDLENIQILKGLKAGENIVTGPFILVSKTLEDGDTVEKKKEEDDKEKEKK